MSDHAIVVNGLEIPVPEGVYYQPCFDNRGSWGRACSPTTQVEFSDLLHYLRNAEVQCENLQKTRYFLRRAVQKVLEAAHAPRKEEED